MRCPDIFTTILVAALALLQSCERQPDSAAPALNSEASADASFVEIPGGQFAMGDENEVDAPPHEVSVTAFAIDKYLVTQELYEKIMGENPSRWKGPRNPVEQVRWSDAVKFCNKRSEAEGFEPCYDLESWTCNFEANGYRLPTEAEWEYACRAGTTTSQFFNNSSQKLEDVAWFDKNSSGRPQPVGIKEPNQWGLYDVYGNVWEWCNDFYKVDYYQESPKDDPTGPPEGDTKVVRGGAWRFSADTCRSGYRYNESPGYVDACFGYDIYGFRCVRRGVTEVR
jgi:sulfatase modifying factor 1